MLYSIALGVLAYHAILFGVGVLVNTVAIEGYFIAFAVLCFICAYLARSSHFVCHMACWLGGISTALVIAQWVLLPILQGNGSAWVTIIAVFAGITCYIATRRYWHRRYLRRDKDNNRPAPPLGKEWARWLIVIVG